MRKFGWQPTNLGVRGTRCGALLGEKVLFPPSPQSLLVHFSMCKVLPSLCARDEEKSLTARSLSN